MSEQARNLGKLTALTMAFVVKLWRKSVPSVARVGHLDLRAQPKVLSVRRSDTPE